VRSTFASVGFAALIVSALSIGVTPDAAATCEDLAGLVLPDTTITAATPVKRPGTFIAPDRTSFPQFPVPRFCGVAATLALTSTAKSIAPFPATW